ncbi:hypothetical protein ElyMa_005506300 [Elysia marginata]|uniref:Uncharacterized protein n=1 Tax=Elysia marginata TaxID=1093978 RepID=A0AAV4EUX1_9GAST|nr:hypothetical protein ElyMa_005506300 [Elysia marginata]
MATNTHRHYIAPIQIATSTHRHQYTSPLHRINTHRHQYTSPPIHTSPPVHIATNTYRHQGESLEARGQNYENLMYSFNCNAISTDRLCGLAARHSLRDWEVLGSIPCRVKPKTLKLV